VWLQRVHLNEVEERVLCERSEDWVEESKTRMTRRSGLKKDQQEIDLKST
jgi:hypothetical protein